MPNELNTWMDWLNTQPELLTLTATLALIVAAWLSNWMVKRILVRAIYRLVGATALGRHGQIKESGIIKRLSNIVPALVLWLGIPMRVAIGTSLVIIAINSLAGAVAHRDDGAFNWMVALFFIVGGLLGSQLGGRAVGRVNEMLLKRGFAGLMVSIALFLIVANAAAVWQTLA